MDGNDWEKGWKMAKGGKTQGYDDKQDESLGMRTGKQSSKTQSSKARRDDSYGKWGKRGKEDRKVTMAHGGKTQGYNDKLDESLGIRTGKATTKLQTKKDRRDESKGMKKSSGKRAYSAVGTMDRENKMMARGGSVKGKIDRDRYVKLQREKKKEIEKLKKEKGALRKEVKSCEKSGGILTDTVITGGSKKNDNQALLLGGIAGILFGAFLGSR